MQYPAGRADVVLVERALAGDPAAHEVIYHRHVRLVIGIARRGRCAPADVDDVVQDTFLIAFANLASLAEPAALRGWLARIAISRVHRRYRWQARQAPAAGGIVEHARSCAAGPDVHMELALVERALGALAVDLRTPWLLRRVEGCALGEIAARCGCSLATAKRRIADADMQLQRRLRR